MKKSSLKNVALFCLYREKKNQSQTQEKRTERARVTPLGSCAQAPVPARAERAPRPRRRRINSESGAREGRSPRSREGAGRRGAGRGSRARCGPAQGVGVACGRAGPRQPAPAQAQSRSVGAGGAWRALRPGLWASRGERQSCGVRSRGDTGGSWTLPFLSFPPSRPLSVIFLVSYLRKKGHCRNQCVPVACLPLSATRLSSQLSVCAHFPGRPELAVYPRPAVLPIHPPVAPLPIHPPAAPRFSPRLPLLSPAARRFSAFYPVSLLIGPILGLSPLCVDFVF